ncbi:hypothetical protein E5676_scaffold35G001700 [Cucumis melo var. makuwa]|uniref:Uncharacterized protein n=2 Tax=Cucumis melo TaxID=3656 RepID=A0A5D3CUV7_CUCMM|nr:hypothetical protein E6C27_scaffold65G002460 [Cucumis melo var. makuwa]TYK15673.1 hypothetical protein E5676_scaffold35G001700 [Cucumis melo var. makuwa]
MLQRPRRSQSKSCPRWKSDMWVKNPLASNWDHRRRSSASIYVGGYSRRLSEELGRRLGFTEPPEKEKQ